MNDQARWMLGNIEDLWGCFDELIAGLKSPEDWGATAWGRLDLCGCPLSHDVLRNVIWSLEPSQRGRNVPKEEQQVQRTIRELNAWNVAKFAQRPASQTPQQSMEQWLGIRTTVRDVLNTTSDEELGQLVWFPLVGAGWVPGLMSGMFGIAHT